MKSVQFRFFENVNKNEFYKVQFLQFFSLFYRALLSLLNLEIQNVKETCFPPLDFLDYLENFGYFFTYTLFL